MKLGSLHLVAHVGHGVHATRAVGALARDVATGVPPCEEHTGQEDRHSLKAIVCAIFESARVSNTRVMRCVLTEALAVEQVASAILVRLRVLDRAED